jgi:hypothetical protein
VAPQIDLHARQNFAFLPPAIPVMLKQSVKTMARFCRRCPARDEQSVLSNVLGELNRSLAKLYGSYGSEGRSSITPQQLLSARLLQLFYGIRSERQLLEGDKPMASFLRSS